MYLTGDNGYQNFLVLTPTLSSVILDSNNNVNRISAGISSEKIKPFHFNLEPTISSLANDRVILKFSKSVSVHKHILLCMVFSF